MGVIYNKEAKEEKLYEAYGMTVYGVVNKYRWFIYEDKPDEECITSIRIVNKNEELINLGFGNNCIMMENFKNTIDNFLYWIDKERPDNYGIEKVIHSSLCQTNSLFNYMINNQKNKEIKNREVAEKQRKIRENQDKKNEQLRELCSKKNMFCYIDRFDECVIFKPLTEKAIEMLNDSDEEKLKMYIDFACKYPDNTDLKFVFKGLVNDYMEG